MKNHRVFLIFSLITGMVFPSLVRSETRVVDFHARHDNNQAVLEWATESETSLDKFLVQRSPDTINWTTVGEVKPGSGDSSVRKEYRFIDETIFKNNTGNFYYRLVIVNKDGRQTSHDVIVSISGSSGIKHTWGSIKALFR